MTTDKLTRAELDHILNTDAPFSQHYGFIVEDFGAGTARIRLPYDRRHIRPGGTISGPAMFALADFGLYVAVMGAIPARRLRARLSLAQICSR